MDEKEKMKESECRMNREKSKTELGEVLIISIC